MALLGWVLRREASWSGPRSPTHRPSFEGAVERMDVQPREAEAAAFGFRRWRTPRLRTIDSAGASRRPAAAVIPHGGTDRADGLQNRLTTWFTRTPARAMPFRLPTPHGARPPRRRPPRRPLLRHRARRPLRRLPPTVYKWVARYRDGGADALADQSRARHKQHARTGPRPSGCIVEARRAHPRGARGSCCPTSPRHDGVVARRHDGGRDPEPPRAHQDAAQATTAEAPRLDAARRRAAPNAVWTIDYKGQFRLGDGELVLPAHGLRRPLPVRAELPRVAVGGAVRGAEAVRAAVREYGLPWRSAPTTASRSPPKRSVA